MTIGFKSLAFVAAALLAVAPVSGPQAKTTEECLGCHADASLTMQKRGRTVPLHVDGAAFGRSVHADLDCTDCHAGFKADEMPHAKSIKPVNCASCHADVAETHKFHTALARATGSETEPGLSCKGCHGTHEVASPKSPGTRFSRSNLTSGCGECHAAVVEQYLDSAHGRAAAQNVKGAPDCLTCHDRPITRARAGGETVERKIEQEKMCLSCHLDDEAVRARTNPSAGFIAAYEASVHGKALLAGNAAAANCVDCHGAHEMKPGLEASAKVSKAHIPETCGACHREIAQQYSVSIHAVALRKGNSDAPVCTSCHGEHTILRHGDPRAPVAPANVSAQVCSPCHSSVRLSEKYGIPSDRFKSFSDSYHGLAIRGGGQVEVANCASCHGAHGIRASRDPASSVSKTNLATTCGRCHPGANERFAMGAVHVVLDQKKDPILFWVTVVYIVLIVGVVGGMAAHNGLDFVSKARRRLQARREGLSETATVAHRLHLRMTLSERIQHAALFVSFIVLAITGFMLHYPDAWWVVGLRALSDRLFDLRSVLHRIAGVVIVLASTYHMYYLAFTARGRQFVKDIWWTWTDLTDARDVLLYNLGLGKTKPRFGRFSYIEKSEYWALVWGNIVMAGTGFILWFENTFIGLITKLGWDVARTVHFYEAWLATLAIVVWHFYYVIFNPDVYPMNLAWLTGTISEEEMREEHPLELEALNRPGAAERAAGPKP
jgi:cytochrome b subunit of formate dehydrogenase